MSNSKYIKLNDNDGVIGKPPYHINFECCDCGLVHRLQVQVKKELNIQITFMRDNRRTTYARRRKGKEE